MSIVTRFGNVMGELVTAVKNPGGREGAASPCKARTVPIRISPDISIALSVLLASLDVVVVVFAVWLAVAETPGDAMIIEIVAFGGCGYLLMSQANGSYRIATSDDLMMSAELAAGLCLLWLGLGCVSACLVDGLNGDAAVVQSVGIGSVVALVGRLLLIAVAACLEETFAERVLLVGSPAAIAWQAQTTAVAGGRTKYVGAFVVREQARGVLAGPVAIGEADGVASPGGDMSLLRHVDRIVLLSAGLNRADLTNILRQLSGLAPEIALLELRGRRCALDARSVGLLTPLRLATISPGERLLKRSIDIVVSSAALLLLLPALLMVGLLIRVESAGPALFRQTRLGCNNVPFTVLKFRTMRRGSAAADGSIQACRNDARVTRLGSLLRKTSIDELPQLLNVLSGSMSLVGPRPHPTGLNRRFAAVVQDYAARHSVTPGITGLAQISGYRGETATVDLMQKRVNLDLEYIRRRSTRLDFWILARTLQSVMTTRNVY